jgi:hypothetical protein
MIFLCFLAVATAVGGLAAVGLALGPVAGAAATSMMFAAPVLGTLSMGCGLAAAVIALRRQPAF